MKTEYISDKHMSNISMTISPNNKRKHEDEEEKDQIRQWPWSLTHLESYARVAAHNFRRSECYENTLFTILHDARVTVHVGRLPNLSHSWREGGAIHGLPC